MRSEGKSLFSGGARIQTTVGEMSDTTWWPHQLDLSVLYEHSSQSNPMGQGFGYAKEFKRLPLNAVIKDLMMDSQDGRPTSAITGAAEEPLLVPDHN